MTVVATPPSFANINRPAWGSGANGSINDEDVRGMFAPRKSIPRTNSSSSIASNASISSTSSTSTLVSSNGSVNGSINGSINGGPVGGSLTPIGDAPTGLPITTLRKRPPQKSQWSTNRPSDGQPDFGRANGGALAAANGMANGASSAAIHQLSSYLPGQMSGSSAALMARQPPESMGSQGQPVLYLVSLNSTFERKTITVPYHPDTLRIGRQTNKSTMPTNINGFFDSKVLSRQHAEIWADRQTGKIYIRDIKSSNGTFVNSSRLSAENRESEPHELQTNDHLELGIDIVSEDQKSVVHHKVAARVEHAGFISPTSNLLDMNYGDLDPANSALMGAQMGGLPYQLRNSGPGTQGVAGRMAPAANAGLQTNGVAMPRNMWLTGPSAEAIVKKLNQEMRNARQQSNDLLRTQEFLKTLLSKDDLRNDAKREEPLNAAAAAAGAAAAARAAQLVNGNGMAFRADPKARFSDPPAPPPQQPLPEKPDVPSLKRGATERPKSGSHSAASPLRPDATGQVSQLTDALKSAKQELDTHQTRVRELEDKLHKEQEARKTAEKLARRLEDEASAQRVNGSATSLSAEVQSQEQSRDLGQETTPNEASVPISAAKRADDVHASSDANKTDDDETTWLRTRLNALTTDMDGMRKQLEDFRKRAEKAEAERDADRETLAQMIVRIRERDERDEQEAKRRSAAAALQASTMIAAEASLAEASSFSGTGAAASGAHAAQTLSKSFSKGRKQHNGTAMGDLFSEQAGTTTATTASTNKSSAEMQQTDPSSSGNESRDEHAMLSRANTITPATSSIQKGGASNGRAVMLQQGVPYASMMGVVLLGVGLMAYLNGWQPQPRLDR